MKTCFILLFLVLSFIAVFAQDDILSSLPPGEKGIENVFNRIKNAGNAEDYDSAAYIIAYDQTDNRVNNLGISYIDNYLLYKILTEEGCKKLAVQTWHYEPMSSFIEIEEINIIRDDSIISVDIEPILDLPAPQSGIYWSDRIKILQMPRLHVSDGLEIKMFKKGYSYALLDDNGAVSPEDEKYIPPMPGEYFDIVRFEATVPIIEKKYTIKLPTEKRLHSQVYNGPMYNNTTYKGDTTIYSWWTKDMPAWQPERNRPGASDLVTKVVMATVESWEAKSRWFFDINESQFKFSEDIKNKVNEIFRLAGVENGTDEEKAFELLHWVAQNIRYSGQTMGEGEGFTLHSGEMIFEQRSGVCKDIAGMLVTMMRAANLDSYAAMTNVGARIEEIPADQFNHCVVALKKNDNTFEMYDPTWVPYYKDIWSKSESEQHYLIGTPQGETRSQIRYSPPEESPLYVTNDGIIHLDGTLEGTMKFRCDGKMDGTMRGLLVWYPLAETEFELAKLLEHISERVVIVDVKHGDVLNFHESMWWDIKYKIPGYAIPIDSGLEFKSPLMALTMGGNTLFRPAQVDWSEERHGDLFFYSTSLVDGTESLKLPKGFKVIEPPQGDEIDETYAYSKGESEMKNGKLLVRQKASYKRRQIPPDGYEGFRKMVKGAKDYAETVFRAEKGGAK